MIPMNFLFNVTLCYVKSCAMLSVSSLVALCSLLRRGVLMTEWVCRWKPCWVLIDDTLKQAYFKDSQFLKDGQNFHLVEDATQSIPLAADSTKVRRSEDKDGTVKHEQPLDASSAPKSSWQAVGAPDAPTWKLSGTQGSSAFWEKPEAPLPHQNAGCNFIHPKQLSPFPERLKLPYPR